MTQTQHLSSLDDLDPERAGRRFYELVDARPYSPDLIRTMFADSFADINRPAVAPAEQTDGEVLVALLEGLAAAFPDGRHEIDLIQQIEPSSVLICWTFSGRHSGASFLGVSAENAEVRFSGIDVMDVTDGVFVQQRHVEDLLGMMAQLSRGPE